MAGSGFINIWDVALIHHTYCPRFCSSCLDCMYQPRSREWVCFWVLASRSGMVHRDDQAHNLTEPGATRGVRPRNALSKY